MPVPGGSTYEIRRNGSSSKCGGTWVKFAELIDNGGGGTPGTPAGGGASCGWENATSTITESEYVSSGGTGVCKWADGVGNTHYGYVSGSTVEFWVSNYRTGVGVDAGTGEPIMFCRQFDEDPSSLDSEGTRPFSYYACSGSGESPCPTGYASVGSFCIETSMSTGKNFYEAGVACADK